MYRVIVPDPGEIKGDLISLYMVGLTRNIILLPPGIGHRHPLVSYGGSAYGLAHFLSNLFRENLAMKCEIGGFPEKYFHLFLEHLRPPIIEAVGDSQAFREGLYFK